jgi:hypothetical protein
MSLESNLKRIADSLEIIAGVLDDNAKESFAASVPLPVEETPGEYKERSQTEELEKEMPVPAPVPAPVEKKVVVPAPAPATEPVVQMTLDQLNTGLIAEHARLAANGDRQAAMDLINGVIKGYGVNTATELAPADYQAVLDAVKAL